MNYLYAFIIVFVVIALSIFVLGMCRAGAQGDEIQKQLMHERDKEIRSVEGK